MTYTENTVQDSDEKAKVSLDKKPGNEGEQHYVRKMVLCDILKSFGAEVLATEDIRSFQGVRFDATVESPDGKTVVIEAGDFNCRSQDIVDRLRSSYEAGADIVYWWPHKPVYESEYISYMDYFRAAADRSCIEHDKCSMMGFLRKTSFSPELDHDVNTSEIYQIDLMHMFEPEIFHRKVLEETEE